MQGNIREKLGFSGSYVISKYKQGTKELIWRSRPIYNLVVSSDGYGRNLIMRRLSNDTTYGYAIDSGAIGTGNTAPANSDTALQASVLSGISVAQYELSNNILIINFFIPSGSLANGTYEEFGLFISSRLFARSIITPAYVKGTNEDTTVEYTLTLN